jgi:hypothetical protein
MITRAFFILVLLGVSGCATSRLEQLDATLRAYERAVRWGDFQTAFALASQSEAPLPDFRRLQNIRITSYDRLGSPQGNADSTRLVQFVEIRYVNVNNMSERVLTDKQEWVYSPSGEHWKLRSAFPAFP